MIMLDYKRILVPYDGSEYAKRALDRAVSVARCCDGAKLFIATVSRPMPPMEKIAREKAYVFDADKKKPEKKDPGQVILDDSEKLIPEDIPHELIFRVGNPGSVLLDLSFEKKLRPGHHGQPGPRRSQEPFHGFRFQPSGKQREMPHPYY